MRSGRLPIGSWHHASAPLSDIHASRDRDTATTSTERLSRSHPSSPPFAEQAPARSARTVPASMGEPARQALKGRRESYKRELRASRQNGHAVARTIRAQANQPRRPVSDHSSPSDQAGHGLFIASILERFGQLAAASADKSRPGSSDEADGSARPPSRIPPGTAPDNERQIGGRVARQVQRWRGSTKIPLAVFHLYSCARGGAPQKPASGDVGWMGGVDRLSTLLVIAERPRIDYRIL